MPRTAVAGTLLSLLLALTSCSSVDQASTSDSSSPEPSVPTLTPIQLPPEGPPTGKLFADLRQSSRDAALGRMEVWIGNDTRRDVTPTRISYTDPRFRAPILGERLRLNPSRSERGYPLTLPLVPTCGARVSAGRVSVAYDDKRVELAVTDDNDIVARYVAGRCLELAVSKVADLRFADEVSSAGSGKGSTGTLTLVVRPAGVPGHVLTIDSLGGTPLFSAVGSSAWRPRARIRSDGPVQQIVLPVQPARCDDHVFMEAAGATAFLVRLHLDGEPGQLIIRMSPAGASNAISFARKSCGLDD